MRERTPNGLTAWESSGWHEADSEGTSCPLCGVIGMSCDSISIGQQTRTIAKISRTAASPVRTRFELMQPKQDCDRTRGRALFSDDPCELLAGVHGGHPVETRLELAKGPRNFRMRRNPGVIRFLIKYTKANEKQ